MNAVDFSSVGLDEAKDVLKREIRRMGEINCAKSTGAGKRHDKRTRTLQDMERARKAKTNKKAPVD
jgi:hypothetical protein